MDNTLDPVMQQIISTNVSDQTGNNANGEQSNGSNVDNISDESRANNDNTETPIGAKKPMQNKTSSEHQHYHGWHDSHDMLTKIAVHSDELSKKTSKKKSNKSQSPISAHDVQYSLRLVCSDYHASKANIEGFKARLRLIGENDFDCSATTAKKDKK